MMPFGMKWYEAWDLTACYECQVGVENEGCNCVVSSTCSLHCPECSHRTYWVGDLPPTRPWEFECAYCGAHVTYPRR